MFGEPLTHLLIGPGPLKRVSIAMVVFRPGSQHMGLELFLAFPRRSFQVIVLERMDEDFRLVQPRRIRRCIPRPPPLLTPGKVLPRTACYVARPSILDKEDALQ